MILNADRFLSCAGHVYAEMGSPGALRVPCKVGIWANAAGLRGCCAAGHVHLALPCQCVCPAERDAGGAGWAAKAHRGHPGGWHDRHSRVPNRRCPAVTQRAWNAPPSGRMLGRMACVQCGTPCATQKRVCRYVPQPLPTKALCVRACQGWCSVPAARKCQCRNLGELLACKRWFLCI